MTGINDLMENDESQDKAPELRRGSEDFFERVRLTKSQFEESRKKTVRKLKSNQFRLSKPLPSPADISATALGADKLWPSLGASNVEALYSEMLFVLTHALKTNTVRDQSETDALISHLKSIFHFDDKKHQALLKEAQNRKARTKFLNLRIMEAKELIAKDANDLSDPFCTLYLTSSKKLKTSIKMATLNPKWFENFCLLIQNEKNEILTVEIWDFDDPEENKIDKIKKITNIRSARGLRNLVRDITSSEKVENDFLGCLQVNLNNIPLDGLDSWFPLLTQQNIRTRGSIHLMMVTSAEGDRKVAIQKYQHVLHLLIVHEIKEENIEPYVWNGVFSKNSTQVILKNVRWQNGLFSCDVDLAKWFVYTRVHSEHPINTSLFPSVFSNLLKHHKKGVFSDDDIHLFKFACDKFVDNASLFFRNIHEILLVDQDGPVQTAHNILNTLEQISKGLPTMEDTIFVEIQRAVIKGAEEMFRAAVCDNLDCDDISVKVETMIQTGHVLLFDLEVRLEKLHPEFKRLLNINYFGSIYRVYDQKYCELVAPLVKSICSSLPPLDESVCQVGSLIIGKSLLQLYLSVLQFAEFASKLEDSKGLGVRGSFHQWFHGSVTRWLQVTFLEAKKRIRKAVQLDELKPSYGSDLQSSSSIDVATTLHQMAQFWNEIGWPEIEDYPDFIDKVLGDVYKCANMYAEEIVKKLHDINIDKSQEAQQCFEISIESCVAANNLELLSAHLKTVSAKVELEKVLAHLKQEHGQETADKYQKDWDVQLLNAVEEIDQKILTIIQAIGQKMKPEIRRSLLKAFEVHVCTAKGCQAAEELIDNLDTNLFKLKDKMKPKGFQNLINITFTNVVTELGQIARNSVAMKKPPEVFREIHKLFKSLPKFFGFFQGSEITDDESMLNSIGFYATNDLLCQHGETTDELILKFQKERYNQQTQLKEQGGKFEHGVITFRTVYSQHTETLQVEILNCSNLPAKDSNGLSDPLVHIGFFPPDICTTPKRTKVIKEDLFPLFDELFSIPLPIEKMSIDGQLHLLVEDYDFIGKNEFIGEVFIPFQSIPCVTTPGTDHIQNFPQIQLPLTVPCSEGVLTILKTLEFRQSDKVAVEFVKKQRLKQY